MSETDLEYCRQNFERGDYPHYLVSLLMPASVRPALWTLGAFKLAIEAIPSSVTEPALGYMRLTWWRDQINILERGGLTKGQPILSALSYLPPQIHPQLIDFINEHESLIENPDDMFLSKTFLKILEQILASDYARYRKLENKLTALMKKHHGTRWEMYPPFFALRLWFAGLI